MKILLVSFAVFFFGLVPHVFAQGFVPLAGIPGLTDPTTANSTDSLATFFNNLYKYLIGLAAIIAIIQIIWAGIEIAWNRDDVSKITDNKGKIYNALYGLVLVLSPVLVFSIINPSILNLSLNLQSLNTVSGTGGEGGTSFCPSGQTGTWPNCTAAACPSGQTGTPPNCTTASGCTVTGTLLKTAICPTQQAAQDFSTACTTGIGNVPFFTTQYKATCDTRSGSITGPYSFADTSSGFLATLFGYSNYEPLASTQTNSNNGSSVMQFASTCTADGGSTCLSTVRLPCASSIVQVIAGGSTTSTSCWNISIFCSDGPKGADACSTNPQFTVVRTN